MNRTTKIILISLGVIGTGVGIYFLLRKPKSNGTTPSIEPNNPTLPPVKKTFPLKRGSKGDKVKQLQRYLNINYSSGLVVDGDFGPKTEAALNTATGLSQVSESWYQNNVLNVNIPTVTDKDNDGIPDSIDIDGGAGTNRAFVDNDDDDNDDNGDDDIYAINYNRDLYNLPISEPDNTSYYIQPYLYGFDGEKTWFNEQNEY